MMIRPLIYLALGIALLTGCSESQAPQPEPAPKPKPTPRPQYEQVCDRCGALWTIELLDRNAPAPPPTVEWCFHDGQMCEVGFEILMDGIKEDRTADARLVAHCRECFGCRASFFDPAAWHKAVD